MTDFFKKVLQSAFGKEFRNVKYQTVGGGCINNTARIITENGDFFIKWNHGHQDMFEKEAMGLKVLGNSKSISVPEVHESGEVDSKGYLLLEHIQSGRMNGSYWEKLGTGLANLHRSSHDLFGLDHDNYIGRLPQYNKWSANWIDFFIHQRLEPQIKLASGAGLLEDRIIDKFNLLYTRLDELIPNETPSLLHGDLWSGNIHCDQYNDPYLIDPAVFYGHREAELAFSKLFGGFDQKFYASDSESFPLQPGFEDRIDIFNLYPLLVHVNLFGASYLGGIIRTLDRYT